MELLRAIKCREHFDNGYEPCRGNKRRAVFEDGVKKVLDLTLVVIGRGIDLLEASAVFCLKLGEQMLFAGDCP